MFYVYILKCNNKKLYIGCMEDLKERMKRHENGHVPAIKGRLPIKLANYIAFQNKYHAYEFEKYLKSGSGRSFVKRHFC